MPTTKLNIASPADWSPRIGFVGLGSQGGPMAERHIAVGRQTTLWARRPETLEPFVSKGAAIAADLQSLGAASDFLGVCVVDDAGAIDVVSKALPGMIAGSVIAVHSTIHPDTCQRLAEQAGARGVFLIDAPVSGGGGAASEQRLTVMTGGDKAVVDACRPLFSDYASCIEYLGGIGAGQLAKLVNNTLMAANLSLAHHAIQTGKALGLDGAALAHVIGISSGGSFSMNVYRNVPSLSALSGAAKLLEKDTNLLASVASKADAGAELLFAAATDFLRIAK